MNYRWSSASKQVILVQISSAAAEDAQQFFQWNTKLFFGKLPITSSIFLLFLVALHVFGFGLKRIFLIAYKIDYEYVGIIPKYES